MATLVGLLACAPAEAQRARQPAKAPDPGLVSVARAATLRITLSASAVTVFEHLSTPAMLTRWFPNQAIFEPEIGGRYHFRWNNAPGLWSGVVTEFIRGNTLAFTWQPPDEPYETNVRIKLTAHGRETMVELTHSGFTSVESLDRAIEAWRFYLENLKSVIETGTDRRGKAPPRTFTARPRRRPA